MSEQTRFASDAYETLVPHASAWCAVPGLPACYTPAPTSTTIFSALGIPHILIAVRTLLSMSSIRFCCLVSHDFHELFIPGLWQRLELGYTSREKNYYGYGGHPSPGFSEAIALYGHNVRHLTFVACSPRTDYIFIGLRTKQAIFAQEDSSSQASLIEDTPPPPPPPCPSPLSLILWTDSAKESISSMLQSCLGKRKTPREEKTVPRPVVTMAQSPLPIATLGHKDVRREGATAELCPNLTSLHIEILPQVGHSWMTQQSEVALLYIARNQRLRSLTLDNFPTRSLMMVALLLRVLSEQSGLHELKLGRALEVSGELFQALLLNLPRAGRDRYGRPQGSPSFRRLEVQWSIDDFEYAKGYVSHGDWHKHDPNHPDRLQAPTLEAGQDGPGGVLWPIYSSLHVIRFLGNLRGSEDNLLIPHLKIACPNLTELHCHSVQIEKREAIRQSTRAPICCFEDENNCIFNENSA